MKQSNFIYIYIYIFFFLYNFFLFIYLFIYIYFFYLTLCDNILDGTAGLVCHEADDGEDDAASEDTRRAVEDGQDASVPVEIVVELVITRHRDEGAPSRTHRKEDLHRRLAPHLHGGTEGSVKHVASPPRPTPAGGYGGFS